MEDLVVASPKSFEFGLVPDVAALVNFRIESKSDASVLFRIKVTNPKRYSVNPPSGVISSKQVMTVAITMRGYSSLPPDVYACKDKFRLEVRLQKISCSCRGWLDLTHFDGYPGADASSALRKEY